MSISVTQSRFVTATLTYLRKTKEKPARYLQERGSLSEWTGIDDPRDLRIADGRGREAEFTREVNGFTLVHAPSVERECPDDKGCAGKYYQECAALVQLLTGADGVVAFDHTLRGAPYGCEPVMRVHGDYTERSATQRILDLFPKPARVVLRRRYRFLNVWRPIGHAVIDRPLALCDARSVRSDDQIASDIIYNGRVLEIAYMRYSPKHRWHCVSEMKQDEVIVFACYDSERSVEAWNCPHSAFSDPTAPVTAKARQSIEVRTVAYFV
jgi:hypothetical protein